MLKEWGWKAVIAYMHGLAWNAAQLLTSRWSTALSTPHDMVGAMVTVPLPPAAGSADEDATRLRLDLLVQDKIEVQLHAWKEGLWARISAQVYNDVSDVERLADAVARRYC
jgi:isopenicillin-N epimerase